jgi:hypothetical protein
VTEEDQIVETIALWAQYADDKNTEAWAGLFAEDGVYIRPNRATTRSRADTFKSRSTKLEVRSEQRHTAHVLGPSVVSVEGDTGESATDYVSYGREGAEGTWEVASIGRLIGTHARIDGRWYFKQIDNQAYFFGDPPPERLPSVAGF